MYVLEKPRPGTAGDRHAGTDFLEAYIPGTETLNTTERPNSKCPRCGEYLGSLGWLPPYEGELECWGREFGDIIPKVNGQDMLVSERFKDLYEEAGLVGLTGFDPVMILRVKRRYRRRVRHDPPPYYRVDAARSRAAIDLERSGCVWEVPPTCRECRENGRGHRRSEAIIIEPGTWSGEDIFIPRGGPLLVSSRCKEFCERQTIRNATFVPAEQYWNCTYYTDDEDRANELLRRPVGGPILEKPIRDGHLMRFDTRTNDVVIYEYVESLRTGRRDLLQLRGHFRPRDAWEFWNRHPSVVASQ